MIRRSWRSFWYALLVTGSWVCGPVCGPVNPVLAGDEPALVAPGAPKVVERVCDPEKPGNCSLPLNAGAVAPFSGQLLTTELSIDLGQKAASCAKVTQIEVARAVEHGQNALTLAQRLHQVDLDTDALKVKLLTERLVEAKRPTPWYERPAFVAPVAVVLAVASCVAVFQVAAEAR